MYADAEVQRRAANLVAELDSTSSARGSQRKQDADTAAAKAKETANETAESHKRRK